MNINFKDEVMMVCQEEWNKLDPEERIQMSHYDLAKLTAIDSSDVWLEFLKDPQVSDQLNAELMLFKEAQQRKLIAKANVNDKSVGTAQLLGALDKTMSNNNGKTKNALFQKYSGRIPIHFKPI